MTPDGANKAVLLAAGVTLGSVTAGYMLPETLGGRGELPPVRIFIGNGLVFTVLSAITGVAPTLAAYFGALAALGALGTYVLVKDGPIEKFFTEAPTAKVQGKKP